MRPSPPIESQPAALGWRLLAIFYDAFPVLALWLAVSAIVLALHGNRPLAPLSPGQWALFLLCWLTSGAYFVRSWLRGGQTLGMRPWRLQVVAPDGAPPSQRALWMRYALATLSFAALGLGFVWSLFDPTRRTWHDLGSRTVLLRLPK